MPMSTSKVVEYYKDHGVQGRILLFDFNFPENGVRELDIRGNFDKSTFRPHGLSIYQNDVTGMLLFNKLHFHAGIGSLFNMTIITVFSLNDTMYYVIITYKLNKELGMLWCTC